MMKIQDNMHWVVSTAFFIIPNVSVSSTLWQDVSFNHQEAFFALSEESSRSLKLNVVQLKDILDQSKPEKLDVHDDELNDHLERPEDINPMIELPLPDGRNVFLELVKSTMMPLSLSQKFPSIETYKVYGDHKAISGRLDLTPLGFHGFLSTPEGTVVIDPINTQEDVYSSRYMQSLHLHEEDSDEPKRAACATTKEESFTTSDFSIKPDPIRETLMQSTVSSTFPLHPIRSERLTYRLAVAVTGEYHQFMGGDPLTTFSEMVTTINRVNQIFEKDLGISLEFVEGNDQLIFQNPETDPYSEGNPSAMMLENQQAIDRIIGGEHYDVGHLFSTNGGGLAGLGVVCQSERKAHGVTGISKPSGDHFAIAYVAHELGHQLGALHSYNGTTSGCDNRQSEGAYEPGSGSTIMAYAGLCGEENLQSSTDPIFHAASIAQISKYTSELEGSQCGYRHKTSNFQPLIIPMKDYIIPQGAAFELETTAVDKDRHQLSYSWEEIDKGAPSTYFDMGDNGNRPLFRSYRPSLSPLRQFDGTVNMRGTNSSVVNAELGEWLPETERELKFRLTVRDSRGGVSYSDVKIDVVDTKESFKITGIEPQAYYKNGLLLSWNVAGTHDSPIYCDKVNVYLSLDAGTSYSLLKKATENDGSEYIEWPNVGVTYGKIKLSCENNVFYTESPEFLLSGNKNIAPTVQNDVAYLFKNSQANLIPLIKNDIDLDSQQLAIEILESVKFGESHLVNVDNQMQLSYSPDQDYSGTDYMKYRLIDEQGNAAEGYVTIHVNEYPSPENDIDFLADVVEVEGDGGDEDQRASRTSGGSFHFYGLVLGILLFIRRLPKNNIKNE